MDSIQDNITFNTNSQPENEIIIYQPDETLKLDVKLAGDTVWLTQGPDGGVIPDLQTEYKSPYQ